MNIEETAEAGRTRSKYGTHFDGFILHCPLPQRVPDNPFHVQWLAAIETFFNDPDINGQFIDPDNLTILTYNNRPEVSLLEHCAERLGLNRLVVLGREVDKWTWWSKISLVMEYLGADACDTEYVLCLDADDVLIVEDPGQILQLFPAFDCDLLFCGTRGDQPPSPMCWDFENRVYASAEPLHRHLNAGGFVGRSEYLESCLAEIRVGYENREPWCFHDEAFDDQLAWRHLHTRHFPRLRVDAGCCLFLRYDEDR